jgi:hypothetical protein
LLCASVEGDRQSIVRLWLVCVSLGFPSDLEPCPPFGGDHPDDIRPVLLASPALFANLKEVFVDTVRDWIAGEFDKPGFASWLTETFTAEGTSHSFGDMVGQRIYTVSRDSLSKLVDVDKLKAVAGQMVADGKDDNNVADHFLQGLNQRF